LQENASIFATVEFNDTSNH